RRMIDRQYLPRASADPSRIATELNLFDADPDAYIERRFSDLSTWDFPVYSAINITIPDKFGRSVRLLFNRVQRRLWQWLLEDLAAGRPIRYFIYKARQMGLSTILIAFLYWLASLRPNRTALVISQDMESVHTFSDRVRAIYEESHTLLASPTKQNRRNVIHFSNPTARGGAGKTRKGAGLDSRGLFIPCTRQALRRSYTIHAAPLSEFAFWEDMGRRKINLKDKLASLRQTIAEAPGTVILIETTPNGLNQAAEIWNEAVAGKNGFRPIFLPWVAFDDYRLPLRDGETL